ncbi:PREDICTED: putative nuclease HARBI1 [Priapulus caudatus]|uniref:Putative nuclease HARBI1 n=1 Tax=Priapulus caudatus TaxID=37621 RepID=A0ABM1F0S4_PRICU|nr:PREDICTED: putative nuclease HARBI1 [Priapulus caudatus]
MWFQVCITLRFLASGAFYNVIGEAMGVQKATVCRVLDAVLDCLVNVASKWIALPISQDQLAEIKVGFYRKRQFPAVIGCVDGTHVAIRTPPRNEDVFVCRKGFHSINVMLINDHKNRITAVSARFPGSAHDMAVFDCSNIQQRMENGDLQNKGLLLADSGYALRPYLMTPVLIATSQRPRGQIQCCSQGDKGKH